MKKIMIILLVFLCGSWSVFAQEYQYHVPQKHKLSVQMFLNEMKKKDVAAATLKLQKIKPEWEVIWSEKLGPYDKLGKFMLIRGPSEMTNLRGETEDRVVNYFFVKIENGQCLFYSTYFNYKDNYRNRGSKIQLRITKTLDIFTDYVVDTKTLFPFVLQVRNGKIMDY